MIILEPKYMKKLLLMQK